MATHAIAVIPGDGIGPEVIEQAIRAADSAVCATGEAVLDCQHFPWGSDHYLRYGVLMPGDGVRQLHDFHAILFGAVGQPDIPDYVTLNGLLLPIRRELDLYVNLRPAYLYEGVRSPLADKPPGAIDLVVLRENTEGEYSDVGGRVYRQTHHEVAIQSSVFTRRGMERIIRASFELAQKRRNHVTSVTKSNAQGYSMVLWDEVFQEVASDYPEVKTRSLLVDAAALELIRNPECFDVVVASNLFGDILSEIAAAVTGSIGLAASANLNPARTGPSMFEPVHGSAPDIAGQGIANPLGAILAVALMLEQLQLPRSAALIGAAVRRLLHSGHTLPRDLGSTADTRAVADAVIRHLQRS